MPRSAIQSGPDDGHALVCRATPGGQLVLDPDVGGAGPPLSAGVHRRIEAAFCRGRGHGVLHLGVAELGTELDPTLSWWRELGQAVVARACAAMDPDSPQAVEIPAAESEELEALAASAPPMSGSELVGVALLADVWGDVGVAFCAEATAHKKGVQGYLEQHNSVWNVVGRVCFHLAENKRDPLYPFAFIATYVHKVTKRAKAQHLPLSRALQQYSGANNKATLLALLRPLSRAAQHSEFMRDLVDSGDVYHALSWTPEQAHQFLREVQTYERAGVVVRIPDWWSSRNRRRPQVTVTIGGKAPAALGMRALLDFDVGLTLDGKALSPREVKALLAATDGLVLLKGNWVEVDREKLTAVLAQWRDVEHRAGADGLGFAEAMRMLAGANIERSAALGGSDESRPQWSEVIAGKWLGRNLDALRSPQVRAQIESGAGLRAELRPYQKVGTQWLWSLRSLGLGACLADDMGLGKTIQVLALLSLLRRNKTRGTDLLVVPASLIGNWSAEMARFAPQLRLFVAHPSQIPSAALRAVHASEVDAHDAVITTYGTVVHNPWIKHHAWRSVILDEAQAIKNPAAKQTRAVKGLKASWRLALTGTPVENKLGDLWSLFDFLNPGLLGSASAFNSFCKGLSGGAHNAYAPLRRLVQPYILRRLKTDKSVISDLPDKTEMTTHCLLSKQQVALYKASVKELERILQEVEGIKRRGIVLAFLVRFKQLCNHPSQWLGDGEYDAEHSGKFARLRELCEAIAARQHKVLVFTQFREMTEPLANFLATVFGRPGLVLHGGTAIKRRQALVQRFQEQEGVPFMVLSLKAGGTGLNLTAASHVIHFDRWWNPAVENQATDRAYRIGQRRNVLVHKFVCSGTVEERIDALVAAKQSLSDEILSAGPEAGLTEMSDEALLGLINLDIGSAVDVG